MSDFWYLDKGRIISLIIAGIYLILAAFSKCRCVLQMLLFLILPLSCIWFSDAMGGFEGVTSKGYMRPTPGIFIKFIGWVLLLLPVIIVIFRIAEK